MSGPGWPEYDLLTHRAETTPERTGLVDADGAARFTYRELDDDVGGVAAGLDAAGVTLGTRVGVLLPTGPAFVRVVHAVARLGGVLVPLDPGLTADRLASRATRAGIDTGVCGSATAETARDVGVDPVVSVADLNGASETLVPIGRDVERLAVVLFTSGTTGEPKGVRLTRGNLFSSAEGSAYRLGIDPGDRWLCCLPMHHAGGLAPVFRTALYGTTLVVQREFDTAETAGVLQQYDVTGVSLVPTMLQRLLDDGWDPPGSLETVLLGGAPASEALIERCADRGVPVHSTYGTTETASQIATARAEQARAHPGTVGQPLVNTTVRVVDDAGSPVPSGETGELVVSGPTVTPGYLDAERTAAAFGEHGLHTGDLGYRDEDGRLWIVGRVDDLIVTGGENVAPATVRAALREHADVTDVAVVGVPDEEWGERVAALVVGSATREELDAHCRERLADYQCPKQYGFVDALPRTASGTVDREAARERLERAQS